MAKITAAKHLRVRYIIGLGLLALVVTGSFLAKQYAISVQHNLSELVKLSGQQSGLVNRIGYLSLVMITTNDDENYANAKLQLQQTIDELESAYEFYRTLMCGHAS